MENELMTIQMTPEEYKEYAHYQKFKQELLESTKQKENMIANLRDRYYLEFTERQTWSKRAITAETKLEKLLEVVHSSISAKTKLEVLIYEIEQISMKEQTNEK